MWNQSLKEIPKLTRKTISFLPNVSKIYERCLNKQLDEYFQALLSKCNFRFQKGYSVINFLLPIIEKWWKSLDEEGSFGFPLTDLSKTFYCLPYELVIANIYAYGEDIPSLKILHSYVTIQKEGLKLNGK